MKTVTRYQIIFEDCDLNTLYTTREEAQIEADKINKSSIEECIVFRCEVALPDKQLRSI